MAQYLPEAETEIFEFALEATRTLIHSLPREHDVEVLAIRVSADLAGRIKAWLSGRAPEARFEPLTERERIVARLIAAGLTNAQIATELHVSRATVSTHVAHVLAKLGFRSRAQVAAWVARRDSPIDHPTSPLKQPASPTFER